MGFSTKQKEQRIIGTVLYCNMEINKFSDSNILHKNNSAIKNLMEKTNIYHYNLIQLFESEYSSEKELINDLLNNNTILNENKNFYSYFNKVYKFIDGYEPNIMTSLNESLFVPDNTDNEIDLLSFKNDLKILINEISKQNNLSTLNKDIIRLKTTLNQPIYINGFNITDNLHLLNLIDKKILPNIFAICYNKFDKQLIFVTEKISDLYGYDIISDEIKKINVGITSSTTSSTTITPFNYLQILKDLINPTLIELKLKTNILNNKIEFKDNLYSDNKRFEFNKIQQSQQNIIKK